MVTITDNTKIEMQWKQVIYSRNNDFVIFDIIPMIEGKDIIAFPNCSRWSTEQDVFSVDEMKEIIFLLERIAWKRDIIIVEMDIPPLVNKKNVVCQGMLEATEGYARLTRDSLFDVKSELNKSQVKEIYCTLEKRFAAQVHGVVKIPKELLIEGSVVKEICLPILEKNENAQVLLV